MNDMKNWIIFAIVFALMTTGAFCSVLADHSEYKDKRWYQKLFHGIDKNDDHEKGKRRRHQKRFRDSYTHDEKGYLIPANNQTYNDKCGACHFVYQPELLPSGSWEKILAELDDHFGETVDLDEVSKKTITEYLKKNSSEYSKSELPIKITKSLGGNNPTRISEIPYIKSKHRKIKQDVFQRESIGSLSNCSTCHMTADKGIYKDDDVKIPQ